MIYIQEKDIIASITLEDLMDSIEEAYEIYDQKNFQMPDRMHVDRPQGTILYMPCFTEEVFGTKIVSTFPENIKKNVASVQGMMVLNDGDTGEPIAIIDGATLTAYRTGAVGGVGVRYTTRKNCQSVGLIGTGVQGFYQLIYAAAARDIKKIYVYDSFTEKLEDFKERLSKRLPNVEIFIAENVDTLVKESEIIITATPSQKPVLPNDQNLLKGKHIISIGSYKPNMKELPEALFMVLDELYIDTKFAAEESGDILTPLDEGWIEKKDIQVFGTDVMNRESKVNLEGKTTLYKSVGMALFDLIVAHKIYKKAIENGLGQKL